MHPVNSAIYNLEDVDIDEEEEEEEEDFDIISIHLNTDTIQMHFDHFYLYSGLIKKELYNRTSIDTIISNVEQNLRLYHIKDSSAKTFFKLLNNESTEIKYKDFTDLCKLAQIFKVKTLKILLQKFAQTSSQDIDFIIYFLLNQQTDETNLISIKLSLKNMEDCLSKNIGKCLQNKKFGQLNFKFIYQIIDKSDKNQINSDVLYDFIIQSIEERISLFSFLDLKRLSNQRFEDLCERNANKNIGVFSNSLEFIKELKQDKEMLLNEVNQLKKENIKLQKQNQQQEKKSSQQHEENSNQQQEHHHIINYSVEKTIMRELSEYQDDDSLLFTIDTEDDDLTSLRVTLSPPENTPYEEGIFFLLVKIPAQYPTCPPFIKFESKIYHPNVNEDGRISLKSLIDDWKVNYNLKKVMEIIYELMKKPDPEYFLVPSIARQYYDDYANFEKTAREWTRKYSV